LTPFQQNKELKKYELHKRNLSYIP